MPRAFDPFRENIRQILLNDWDPSDASRFEAAHGEYDSYVDPLYDLIVSGADEEMIMDFLYERERECMCFPPVSKDPLRRVAQKLASLRASEGAHG